MLCQWTTVVSNSSILYPCRKSSISRWRTSTRECKVKTTTCCRDNVTTTRKKCRMLCFCKRRKRPSNPKWSSSRMSRRKDRITSARSKKIRWRTRSAYSLSALHVGRSKRSSAERWWWHARSTTISVVKRSICAMLRWTRLPKWRNLRWSSSSVCRTRRLFRRRPT